MTQKPAAETPPPAEKPSDPFEGLVPGRIVHYWPMPFEARNAAPGPWPGMVTRVGENGVCTINVNVPVPAMVGTDPVARKQNVVFSFAKDGPAAGCWTWMFQGQGTRYRSDPPSALPEMKP